MQGSRLRTNAKTLVTCSLGLLILSACSSSNHGAANGNSPSGASANGSTAARTGQAITVALLNPIPTLDPIADLATGTDVEENLFQTLTHNVDGKQEPWLAKSWNTTDGKVWTYHLDPHAKFQNGTPVTAADVVYTMDLTLKPSNPKAPELSGVAKVTAVNKETVQFRLKSSDAAFPTTLAVVFIVPKAYYQKVGSHRFGQAPIGSGQYKFVKMLPGGGVELAPSSTYDGPPAEFSRVDFVPVPDPQSRVSGLQSGQLDIIDDIPFNDVSNLRSNSAIHVETMPSSSSEFLAMDPNSGPTSDPKVRAAIDMAIDRSAIVSKLLFGLGKPLGSPVPETVAGYDPNLKPTPYDPSKAKALVKGSSYNGQQIDFTYPTSNLDGGDDLARAVVGYLSAIGLNVKPVPLEWNTFLGDWAAKKMTGIYLMEYRNGGDAQVIITSLYSRGSRALFNDPKTFSLAQQEQAQTDAAKRQALLNQLWEYTLGQQHYYSALVVPDVTYGVSAKASAWKGTSDDRINLTTF